MWENSLCRSAVPNGLFLPIELSPVVFGLVRADWADTLRRCGYSSRPRRRSNCSSPALPCFVVRSVGPAAHWSAMGISAGSIRRRSAAYGPGAFAARKVRDTGAAVAHRAFGWGAAFPGAVSAPSNCGRSSKPFSPIDPSRRHGNGPGFRSRWTLGTGSTGTSAGARACCARICVRARRRRREKRGCPSSRYLPT